MHSYCMLVACSSCFGSGGLAAAHEAQALPSGRLQMSLDAMTSPMLKVTMAAVAMGATAVLLGRRQSLPSLGLLSTAPAVAQLELAAAASPSPTAPATALVGRMAAATLPGMSTATWWAPRACRAEPGTTLAGATPAARTLAAWGTTTAPQLQASLCSASCHNLQAALARARMHGEPPSAFLVPLLPPVHFVA